jgi:hypothetical protein
LCAARRSAHSAVPPSARGAFYEHLIEECKGKKQIVLFTVIHLCDISSGQQIIILTIYKMLISDRRT